MPKEYTHWLIAQKILEAPSGPSPAGPVMEAVRSFPYCFLLGSVTPDTPFYYLYGQNKETFKKIALQTHGERENDSFVSLKEILRRYRLEIPPPLLSLFAGTACHVITDALFHPLVRVLTGTVEEEMHKGEKPQRARRRIIEKHYLVETCLDVYVRQNSFLPEGGRYRDILSGAKRENPDLIEHLSLYFFRESKGHQKEVSRAIHLHSQIQGSFHSPAPAVLITLISPFFSSLQPFRRSFYPQFLNKTYSFFDSVISPPQEEGAGQSLFAELATLAQENCARTFARINAFIADKNFFFHEKGPEANGRYPAGSMGSTEGGPARIIEQVNRNFFPRWPLTTEELLAHLERPLF